MGSREVEIGRGSNEASCTARAFVETVALMTAVQISQSMTLFSKPLEIASVRLRSLLGRRFFVVNVTSLGCSDRFHPC